jgi:DNA-directed RNA polymerase specialized sigma24 family protein
MTDTEITEHLKNNRYSLAIKGLYNQLPQVKKYILGNSGTGEDAGDIFQDALVVLYKKIQAGDFVLTVPLKTYLQAVVKNLWMQELRRRKKMPVTGSEIDMADPLPDAGENFAIASAAFNFLGEKCRELLILFYF